MSSEIRPMKIRKASAGSGKTFLLVQNYISLLLKQKKNNKPFPHRTILAVTFTNKATKEMKTRILKELFILSDSQKESEHREFLCKNLDYTPDDLAVQSKQLLLGILNDYSSFHISTIDRFFLKILRSFTREINLQSDYTIELDTTKVLNESVKKMLLNLDKDDNLFDWLLSFSREKIDNDKSWDIEKDILKLSKNLFREDVKTLKLPEQQLVKNYHKNLKAIVKAFDSKTKIIAENADAVLGKYHLSTDDFSYTKSSFFNQFLRAKNKVYKCSDRFINSIDNVDKWYPKKSKREADIKNAFGELNPLMKKLYDLIKESSADFIKYNSAKQVLNKIYELGILSDVTKAIKNFLNEEGILLLSDMNEFLSQIIKNSDTPFIYEKTGISIEHFMLDEFQDTSALQWKNFLPLIQESLASNNENLIVGDVKQSIYRWRNSDWDLLNSKIMEDLESESIDDDSSKLKGNWRSLENIVKFNNDFFKFASETAKTTFQNQNQEICEKYSAKIETAYEVLEQEVKRKDGGKGNVELTFIEQTKDGKFIDFALNLLVQKIEELQDRGYALKDITILVRKGVEIRQIADFLSRYEKKKNYRYDIVSEEALLVAKSDSVQFLISAMKCYAFPKDKMCEFFFLFNYFTFIEKLELGEAINKALNEDDDSKKLIFKNNSVFLNKGSLYEQVESLIKFFDFLNDKPEEVIYVQTFQDIVFDFIKKNNADLVRFLNYWEEKRETFYLPSSEDSQDAMRIITIHSSKGLEFNVVLLPFCNWDLEPNMGSKEHLIWLNTQNLEEPFRNYPIVPIAYKKDLAQTIFAEPYYEEMMQCYVDTLNITYVAFTRAKKELYVFIDNPSSSDTQKKKDAAKNSTIPSFLRKYADENLGEWKKVANSEGSPYETYRKGDFEKILKSEEECTQKEDILHLVYPIGDIDWNKALIAKKMWELSSDSSIKMKIDYGVLMHEILSKVETLEHLSVAVDSYLRSGKITQEEGLELTSKVENFIRKHQLEDWFSGKYRVLNEVDILSDNKVRRPDRIMLLDKKAIVVDYKFGQKESSGYKKQIQMFCDLIKNMGYCEVEGYLCYVELDRIYREV